MSLLGTLAKVAVGVAVAKGVSGMAKGEGARPRSGGAGTGSVFDDLLSPIGSTQTRNGNSGGGLTDILAGGSKGGGSLGDLLSGGAGGGLAELGKILAGGGAARGQSQGGLGGLLDGLSQASRPQGGAIPAAPPRGGSLGDLLNQSLDNFGAPVIQPEPAQEDAAQILLRAMLQAAKSDERIDADEKKNLLGQMGDISRKESAFINGELAKPVDVQALAQDVPRGMGSQVYMMSLMAIDLDSQNEAKHLHELARALGISPQEANAIHDRVGEPKIYG